MRKARNIIGGLGNLMFKQAFITGKFLDGEIPEAYVQSERYWRHHKDSIKRLFSEGINFTNKVSLHIRRGDYMSTDFYINLTDTNYYEEAVKHFPNEEFLVFCHDNQDPEQDKLDKEWVKQFLDSLIPNRYEIHKPESENRDLNKMAGCKSQIMANSTFSWWASYLNPNPSAKIICPKSWFTDGVQRCELMDEWIKI